jgi:hypothetical protein
MTKKFRVETVTPIYGEYIVRATEIDEAEKILKEALFIPDGVRITLEREPWLGDTRITYEDTEEMEGE